MINKVKQYKNIARRPKISTLSFHCITLSVICQVLMAILGPISATNAASSSFYFEDYTADYYLSKAEDGTSRLRVKEVFTTVFPSTYLGNSNAYHGITRVIPYTNQDGQNLTMESTDYLAIDIRHNGITTKPYKIEDGDGNFTVYIGDPDTIVKGEQIYELEYEFRNVITEFDDDSKSWQELYWDTNGNDWQQKFKNVTARVHFEDDAIMDSFTKEAWCYVGRYGENGSSRCEIRQTTDGVEFRAKNLSAGENLTFDLEFEPDTFVMGKKLLDYRLVITFVIELLFAVGIIIAIFIISKQVKAKRDTYKATFIKPEYQPPHGFSVAEMAENFVNKSGLGSSKVATLLELAVTNKVEIIKEETKSKLGKVKTKWKIKIKSLDLLPEQVTILKILNGGTDSLSSGQVIKVETHSANSTLIKLGQNFSRYARDRLRTKGLMEVDSKKAQKSSSEPTAKNPCNILLTVAIIWFFVNIIGCIYLFEDVPTYRIMVGGGLLIALIFLTFLMSFALALFASSRLSPYFTHTVKGLEYSRYLDGLKLYIKMAEAERMKVLQSVEGADTSHQGIVKLYEKLLPYAVLFKLEKSWLNEMSRYYEFNDVDAPIWYVGAGAFSAHEFSSAVSAMSSYVATTTTHSTTSNSSSRSSGGGGGGFSGGGGGGGGGGGW